MDNKVINAYERLRLICVDCSYKGVDVSCVWECVNFAGYDN